MTTDLMQQNGTLIHSFVTAGLRGTHKPKARIYAIFRNEEIPNKTEYGKTSEHFDFRMRENVVKSVPIRTVTNLLSGDVQHNS